VWLQRGELLVCKLQPASLQRSNRNNINSGHSVATLQLLLQLLLLLLLLLLQLLLLLLLLLHAVPLVGAPWDPGTLRF